MKRLKNWLTFVDTWTPGRSRSSLLGLLVASLLAISPAWATNRTPPPDPEPTSSQADAQADAEARAHAGAEADANAQADSGNAQAHPPRGPAYVDTDCDLRHGDDGFFARQ